MDTKDLIFQADSIFIIENIVKKYGLKVEDPDGGGEFSGEALAGGEIAQAARDVVKNRFSLEECSAKFQKIFNISLEKANDIVKELNKQVILRASSTGSEGKIFSPNEIIISNKKESAPIQNNNQDSYREPVK